VAESSGKTSCSPSVKLSNSRGVHWRGEGGDQERELAKKYRNWGKALQVSHPFVAAKLLMELAKTYAHLFIAIPSEPSVARYGV
jgi:hypothetical protein